MSATFGNNIKTTVFGQSHGHYIGAVVDGLPLGFKIDMDKLEEFMRRRAPGKKYTTKRVEGDNVEFIAGVEDATIISNTICAVIKNKDHNSTHYEIFKDIPRPSHADYVANIKYNGLMDMRGSGSFSGRLTAPICIVGGIAKQILQERGIQIASRLRQVGAEIDEAIDIANPDMEVLEEINRKSVPVISEKVEARIEKLLEGIREEKDSIGAKIECFATGIPIGLGEPNQDGIESILSSRIFSIPGVRAIEFGLGVEAAYMKGSEHNDEFKIRDKQVSTMTNNAGGIVGGISNGMPINFTVTMKPTASIGKRQRSFSMSKKESKYLQIEGRHDPCIAIRALPVIEAVCAIVLLDLIDIL